MRKDAAAAIDKTRQSSSPSESSNKDQTRTRDKVLKRVFLQGSSKPMRLRH